MIPSAPLIWNDCQFDANASGLVQRLIPDTWPLIADVINLADAKTFTLAGAVCQSYAALTPLAEIVAVAPDVSPVSVLVATKALPPKAPT